MPALPSTDPLPDLIPAWDNDALVPVEKLAVHRRGLRHPAVSVFVMAGDRLLIQQRAAGKYHTPGLWTNTCCTHPAWGENPRDCAIRRLRQELGITGLAPEPRGQVEYRADVGGGLTEHEVVDIFLCRAEGELPLRPDAGEVAAVRWIGLGALRHDVGRHPGHYTPWLRIYLAEHSGRIFGAADPGPDGPLRS